MSKIDISVILIVHNGADYLPMCLNHLEHQSFPAARFEVIVVDDASTDASYEILKRYAEGAPMRIQVLHQPEEHPGQARNLALESAEGYWLLFLDQHLLAGPHLIERHLEAQERLGDASAVIGGIHRHPHLGRDALTTWLMPGQLHSVPQENVPLSFLDWNVANMSLPRHFFSEFGGFDTSVSFEGFEVAELAWRLMSHGIQAFADSSATAYVWRPVSLQYRRRNAYLQGYALYDLEQFLRSGEIQLRYGLDRSGVKQLIDSFIIPLMVRLSREKANNLPAMHWLVPRILSYDLYSGYKDARLGRPLRVKKTYNLEASIDPLPPHKSGK